MNKVNRWLLPEGIEEVLPAEALEIEALRRKMVDLFQSWGYDYVIPPMVEFTDSLLTGSGKDIDLLTFKLTDQISGKTLGIRADITPQTARMDAHSLRRDGVNRLCYAGHVMHARPKGPLASRTPLQAGVELYGVHSLDADIEVISLLLETLINTRLPEIYIDIGHVGIYRALVEIVDFTQEQERSLFGYLQSKALPELDLWLTENVSDRRHQEWLRALPKLCGGSAVLRHARNAFTGAPSEVHAALDELENIAGVVESRYPSVQFYFDLGELRGYDYHTGIVFDAFAPGLGNEIANGGRYDHVGEEFGRARAATGFAIDLSALSRLIESSQGAQTGIFAPYSGDEKSWQKIKELRLRGERVVVGLAEQPGPLPHQRCDRQLVVVEGEFEIQSI